jgi:hypothetical protein
MLRNLFFFRYHDRYAKYKIIHVKKIKLTLFSKLLIFQNAQNHNSPSDLNTHRSDLLLS